MRETWFTVFILTFYAFFGERCAFAENELLFSAGDYPLVSRGVSA
jgi:hypothetical protein